MLFLLFCFCFDEISIIPHSLHGPGPWRCDCPVPSHSPTAGVQRINTRQASLHSRLLVGSKGLISVCLPDDNMSHLCFISNALTTSSHHQLVSVRPGNAALGLPTVPAVVLLFDAATAMPLCIMDGTYLTALRCGLGSCMGLCDLLQLSQHPCSSHTGRQPAVAWRQRRWPNEMHACWWCLGQGFRRVSTCLPC